MAWNPANTQRGVRMLSHHSLEKSTTTTPHHLVMPKPIRKAHKLALPFFSSKSNLYWMQVLFKMRHGGRYWPTSEMPTLMGPKQKDWQETWGDPRQVGEPVSKQTNRNANMKRPRYAHQYPHMQAISILYTDSTSRGNQKSGFMPAHGQASSCFSP